MKNRILKALASFGLSVCVLAGSSVVSMAEETPGKTECKEHTWKTTTEYKTECVETTFQHKLPDGTTETLTLCPECGKVKNNTQLTKVNGVFSNFSNLTVHTGTLKNGEQVMTAAFYYPTVIERVICEKCGTVKSEEVTPARVMAQPVIASIEVPANTVSGYSLMQINARAITGAVISRHKHGEQISIPTAHTVLRENDYIQAVGSDEALNQLATLVGEREEGELPLSHTQEIESLLLTKKDMINKQLGDLNLMKNFGCTVTRVRRSGIDLAPSPDLALKFGDKLTVVGEKEGLKGLARLLGNNAKKLSDTDFFPIAMGIVLGVLFGKLNISFPGGLSFSPGLTGGILIVALFLSAIGKTGPVIWSMSGPANQLLRQLGLLLFLAEVGTSAGKNLVATFQESGWLLFGVGAAITLVPMLIAVIVGRMVFKISILDLLGTITGGMTSTPGLAAADSMTDSNIPSVAYATVYPIAMVFLILSIQIIATMI